MTNPATNRLNNLAAHLEFAQPKGEISDFYLNKTDDCFNQMSSYWQKGQYTSVLLLADSQPLFCLCDIRIAVYYLYCLWLSPSPISSEAILMSLVELLEHQQQPWKLMLPQTPNDSADKILVTSITVLLHKMLNHLRHPEGIHQPANQQPDKVLIALGRLKQALPAGLITNHQQLRDCLMTTQDYFSDLAKMLQTQPSAGLKTKPNEIVQPGQPPSANETAEHHNDAADLTEPSGALLILMQRMTALQSLLQKQQYLKAAVVLQDLQNELENFNPLLYFPQYFGSFTTTRAHYAGLLEPYFEQQNSLHWKALYQCYQSDLQAFLAVPEISESGRDEFSTHDGYEHYDG